MKSLQFTQIKMCFHIYKIYDVKFSPSKKMFMRGALLGSKLIYYPGELNVRFKELLY